MPRRGEMRRKVRSSESREVPIKKSPIPSSTSPATSAMPLLKNSPPKVLVPEKLSPDGLALLRSSLDVDERKGLSPEELLEIIPNYEALMVRSETKVTATVLRAARRLKVVARAGVGVDNVGASLDPVAVDQASC